MKLKMPKLTKNQKRNLVFGAIGSIVAFAAYKAYQSSKGGSQPSLTGPIPAKGTVPRISLAN